MGPHGGLLGRKARIVGWNSPSWAPLGAVLRPHHRPRNQNGLSRNGLREKGGKFWEQEEARERGGNVLRQSVSGARWMRAPGPEHRPGMWALLRTTREMETGRAREREAGTCSGRAFPEHAGWEPGPEHPPGMRVSGCWGRLVLGPPGASECPSGLPGGLLEPPGGLWGRRGRVVGWSSPSWTRLGAVWKPSWAVLGSSWAGLRASCAVSGAR